MRPEGGEIHPHPTRQGLGDTEPGQGVTHAREQISGDLSGLRQERAEDEQELFFRQAVAGGRVQVLQLVEGWRSRTSKGSSHEKGIAGSKSGRCNALS